MDSGSINTDSLLLARGVGIGPYGYGYGSGAFATPSSNAVRVNRNADLAREQNRAIALTLDQAEESRRFSGICDRINDMELRTSDRLRDLERDNEARFRSLEQCCCDQKVQQCKDTAALTAEIKAIESRTISRELDRAERRINQLEIFRECGCGCAGGVQTCNGS